MASIQLLLIALAPSIGTLLTIILIAFKICKRFVDLRAEVKDDKTINALLTDNKKLAKLYSDTMADVKELSTQVDNLRTITVDLAEKYNIDTNKLIEELVELKDDLTMVVRNNKELQKELNYTISAASNEEV